MNIKDFTYNEISMLAFGEAQSIKTDIDALVIENERLERLVSELSNTVDVVLRDRL